MRRDRSKAPPKMQWAKSLRRNKLMQSNKWYKNRLKMILKSLRRKNKSLVKQLKETLKIRENPFNKESQIADAPFLKIGHSSVLPPCNLMITWDLWCSLVWLSKIALDSLPSQFFKRRTLILNLIILRTSSIISQKVLAGEINTLSSLRSDWVVSVEPILSQRAAKWGVWILYLKDLAPLLEWREVLFPDFRLLLAE